MGSHPPQQGKLVRFTTAFGAAVAGGLVGSMSNNWLVCAATTVAGLGVYFALEARDKRRRP